MKQFSISLILVCLSCFIAAQNKIDVLHYKYTIELNDNNDTIKGFAEIKFIAKENLTVFSFDLTMPGKDKKGMIVSAAGFNKPDLPALQFKQESDKIIISSSTYISKGDIISVFLNYKGIPTDGLIISKNKYGNRTFFLTTGPTEHITGFPV